MADMETVTRKEQILHLLLEANGEWVDGSRLATEEVGGSEGLRRLRELRSDGYRIQQRRHPDPDRAIWQYRIMREEEKVSPKRRLVFGESRLCSYCDATGKKAGSPCMHCRGQGWT